MLLFSVPHLVCAAPADQQCASCLRGYHPNVFHVLVRHVLRLPASMLLLAPIPDLVGLTG
jgi:hypothetical protein